MCKSRDIYVRVGCEREIICVNNFTILDDLDLNNNRSIKSVSEEGKEIILEVSREKRTYNVTYPFTNRGNEEDISDNFIVRIVGRRIAKFIVGGLIFFLILLVLMFCKKGSKLCGSKEKTQKDDDASGALFRTI